MIFSLIFLLANLIGYIVVARLVMSLNAREMARLQRQADAFERLATKYEQIAERAIAQGTVETVCPLCGVIDEDPQESTKYAN